MQFADTKEQQPAPAQAPASPATKDTRHVLQSRAQQLQGGSLTDLLMAWFDAGYQTGRHEALSQQY